MKKTARSNPRPSLRARTRPCAVIITAAGSGQRLGAPCPKALVEIAGHSLLWWATRTAIQTPGLRALVITAPAAAPTSAPTDSPSGDWCTTFATEALEAGASLGLFSMHDDAARTACSPNGFAAGADGPLIAVIPGGASRQQSVFAGLARANHLLGPAATSATALIHDAARAFTPLEVFTEVADALEDASASADASAGPAAGSANPASSADGPIRGVVPGLKVVDTIKLIEGGEQEIIVQTPPRARLRAIQTPQAFTLADILDVHRRAPQLVAAAESADVEDSRMIELDGGRVRVIPGDERSLKITVPADLRIGEQIARNAGE